MPQGVPKISGSAFGLNGSEAGNQRNFHSDKADEDATALTGFKEKWVCSASFS